jgi:membrane protein implicated in regulation of membrane protease activity
VDEDYVLMPMELEKEQQHQQGQSNSKYSSRQRLREQELLEEDEKYVAKVALSIQIAMAFFCFLIVIAVFMSVFSIQGYFVVIIVSLTILTSLSFGLCFFIYQVLNEDDAPQVNQKHMPQWYKTLRKVIKDELEGFRDDWRAMCNNLYLMEDGEAGTSSNINMPQDFSDEAAATTASGSKPKKRRGKSVLFKIVAKPVAVLANLGRKRREKKKKAKKKAQKRDEFYYPPVV